MPDFFNLHPFVALMYFAGVLIYTMVFMHPVLVAISVALSFAACFCLCRKETLASRKYTLTFGVLIALLNPLFSTGGDTVLFTYFGRNYTLQALIYGCIMAGIFITTINWFACLGKIIDTDKFMFLLGGRFPNICIMLTMVMGLVPFFQSKLAEISDVQNTLLPQSGRTKSAFRALGVATSYAFEHAINLSVSMKNRGFGSGSTTRFHNYKIKKYDVILFIIIVLLNFMVAANLFGAAVTVEIIPAVVLVKAGAKEVTGGICFVVLLLLPAIMHILKELQWQYLKSRI